MKVLFNDLRTYSGVKFENGKVYDLPEENGFASRWLKRNAKFVPDFTGELAHNRFCIVQEKTSVKVKVEEVIAPVDTVVEKAEIVEDEVKAEDTIVSEDKAVTETIVSDEELSALDEAAVEVAKESKTADNKPKSVRKPRKANKK